MEISKSQFKARALELFRRIEADGERLVVTDRGTPTLEVRRYVDRTRAPLDVLRGTVVRYDRPTDPVADDDWDALR
jgi:antitoxin (DNA-binding transcriptional repressor) of toxin-antitoxin stability system